MRQGGGGGGDEAGGDMDLDLVANLKAHRTPPGVHDGVPDNCAHGLAMPYDMHSQGLWVGDSQGMPMAPTEHALRLVGTQGAWSEGMQGMHRPWTRHALGVHGAHIGQVYIACVHCMVIPVIVSKRLETGPFGSAQTGYHSKGGVF